MLDWFRSTFFTRRTLAGLSGPIRVRVHGRLSGEERVVSPMTGRRGLAVEYRFWDRRVIDGPLNHRRPVRYAVPLVMSRIGDSLSVMVDRQTVLVPVVDELRVIFIGSWDPGYVPHLLPDVYTRSHRELDRFIEDLSYDEKVLHAGTEVELEAIVEPVPPAPRSAYRGGGEAPWDFEARPRLGPAVLRELALP